MPDDQVIPAAGTEGETGLPAPFAKKLPQRLHGTARSLLELNAGDRAKIFQSFNKPPPGTMMVGQVLTQTVVQANMWQGPLPQPEHLEKFNAVVPGAAERIIAMAEKQQAHRISLEDHAVKQQLSQSGRGQIFGLVIGLGGIGLAGYLAYLGLGTAAGTIGSVTLSGLAIAFIIGRSNQAKSGREKGKPAQGGA